MSFKTTCFNRYIVECKYNSISIGNTCSSVLIDTQWNVNEAIDASALEDLQVLIDTQWNVNYYNFGNMSCDHIVLIDTQWNVN